MKLSSQLLAITAISLAAVLVVLSVGKWSTDRVRALQETQDKGTELLMKSNAVHNQLKNVMFELLSPRAYGLLKDVVHVPRAIHLVRSLNDSVEEFSETYDGFFDSEEIQRLVTNDELEREYITARRIGDRALQDIERTQETLSRIDNLQSGDRDDIYRAIIVDQDRDESLLTDVRSVSYYFSETFERYLQHFIAQLATTSDALQQRTQWLFRATTAIAVVSALGLSLLFAARLTKRLQHFERGVESLSRGEFGISLPEGSNDEIGILLRRFNDVTGQLAKNIDSISGLLGTVSEQISRSPEFPRLLEGIADATLRYTNAECIAMYGSDDRGTSREIVFRSKHRLTPDTRVEWTRNFPLHTRIHPDLSMSVGTIDNHLSDLDMSHLRTFSRYATLLIDHNHIYRELAERRKVAYDALQAQIQPHFLFNVLGGIFGLNRNGDREAVERSIICLRHMLRYIVDGPDTTTLEKEMEFSRRYLELQKIRFGDDLHAEVECDPDVAEIEVPKLVLQPLVENAIVHGIEGRSNKGTVRVTAAGEHSGYCTIKVEDDGSGFDRSVYSDSSPDEESGSHIGITNVRRRLAIAYPGTRFDIDTEPGAGTRVSIVIPLLASWNITQGQLEANANSNR